MVLFFSPNNLIYGDVNNLIYGVVFTTSYMKRSLYMRRSSYIALFESLGGHVAGHFGRPYGPIQWMAFILPVPSNLNLMRTS